MKLNSLEAFYTEFAARVGSESDALQPPGMQRDLGHFNVFNVADLMRGNRPPMTFDRRSFYKISLIRGRGRAEYADRELDIRERSLWFSTPRLPYRWLPQAPVQVGYFCLFTAEFLLPAKGGTALDELPLLQPGGHPVLELAEEDYAALEAIFEKMAREIASDFAYKYDLLRAYLWELIYYGQKLQPAPARAPTHAAAARVAARFADLLERQFPLAAPAQRLPLRTAADYAGRLAVHVNHLNRVLKETTGRTTTALIGHRVAQEAKLLLKQTDWSLTEIADGLGFTDVAHFCKFFKRQTALTPGDFRG